MPTFDWQRKPSANFGDVWVPVAVVQLQAASGRFRSFQGYLDSGAVVSLLRRSAADELGLRLETGRRIVLTGLGASHTEAFVHELTIRFVEGEKVRRAPVAIATSESVPNLLGRLGIFDQFDVAFDSKRRETRIVLP